MKKRPLYIAAAAVGLIIVGLVLYFFLNPPAKVYSNDVQVRAVVTYFGDELSQVRLNDTKENIAKNIDARYALYVRPDLLDAWKANPATAPGRTEDVWPDRMEIQKIDKQSDGTYLVEAWVITKEKDYSPTAPTTWFPVMLTVAQGPDGWQITNYELIS